MIVNYFGFFAYELTVRIFWKSSHLMKHKCSIKCSTMSFLFFKFTFFENNSIFAMMCQVPYLTVLVRALGSLYFKIV